jgi:hypothetical protein
MKNVIALIELDKSDREKTLIGIATTRERALEIINYYYGPGDHVVIDFTDVREDNIDFICDIKVEGKFGGVYQVWGEDFIVDSL